MNLSTSIRKLTLLFVVLFMALSAGLASDRSATGRIKST